MGKPRLAQTWLAQNDNGPLQFGDLLLRDGSLIRGISRNDQHPINIRGVDGGTHEMGNLLPLARTLDGPARHGTANRRIIILPAT